jgi:NAD(P)-dependent dehydrogenase (short-subunit alcohol dehydrogenase family)
MDNGLRGSPHSRERGEPRLHDTLGLSDLLPSSEVGQQQKKLIPNTVPLGRFGTPDEIAKAVVSRIRRITGIELFVDGGVAQV